MARWCNYAAYSLLLAIVSPGLFGQSPSGVSFTLSTKDGKTTFRLGESVDVEYRFQSTVPGAYGVWTMQTTRTVRKSEYDHFIVEPSEGAADPLSDIFAQMSGGVASFPPRPSPLAGVAVTIGLQMNEWLSFRRPGHYRVTAETTRVVASAQTGQTVPLRSNTIEIDVVAPEPGWAAAQLQEAVGVFQVPDPPPPVIGQTVNLGDEQSRDADVGRAARTLRFLDTKDAAPALARFFEHGPRVAQAELHAGLFASPYRKEVIAAMEEAVAAPDIPITYYYLGTLMELAELSRFGGLPVYTAKTPEEIRRWGEEVEGPYREKTKAVEPEYFAKLAGAIGQKHGGRPSRWSLETLLTRGPQPAGPATVKALVANFRLLPEFSQQMFLTQQWYWIASPELGPMLQSLAEGSGALRDSALRRLQEVNPEAARKIIVDRIQRADVLQEASESIRALLSLPDKTLPEADDALAAALEHNKPYADTLVARYASEAVLPRLRAWVEQAPQRMCDPVLPAYFFRVDAAWASEALARARKIGGAGCAINLSSEEDLLMSPGLERQAIEDLSNPDLLVRRSAQTLLQYAGSAAAEKPLLEAFGRLHAAGVNATDVMSYGVEQGFVSALLSANGWLASEEAFNQAVLYCVTDQCRHQASSARKMLEPPISLDVVPTVPDFSSVGIGTLGLRSFRQFQDKVAQFPRGTAFSLSTYGEGSWYYQQRATAVRKALADAGMKVVDRPAVAR